MRLPLLVSFFFLVLIQTSPLFSQTTSYIDSLERELTKVTDNAKKVDLLTNLSSAYNFLDLHKGREYALKAVDLSEGLTDNVRKYRANQTLALNYGIGGDYTSALKYETISLKLAVEDKDTSSIGLSHSNIGNDYYELGKYDESYYYLTRAYRMLQKTAKDANDSLYMNLALHNVGRVFKELGQYDIALDHLRLSRKISKQIDDEEGEPYSLDEIGDVKLRLGEYDSALYYLNASLKATRELFSNPFSFVVELHPKTIIKLAQAYQHLRQMDKAMAYYDTAFNIYSLTRNQFGIAEVEQGRASILRDMGKYDEAMDYFDRSLTIAHKINARVLEIKCYNQLADLWERKGDYKKSLENYKQYKALDDSLFSQEMQQRLFREQLRFETESKDVQIAALTQLEELRKSEIKRQQFIRNVLVVLMALTAILLFTVYRSGQRRKRINLLLLHHQEEMEKRSEELEQLNKVKDKFFSIISHDLRSPINALAGVLDLLDKGAISEAELPMALKELRVRFNHTRTLLNNLLDWTLLQMDKLNLQPAKINLHQLVSENIDLLNSIQTKKISLVNKVPAKAIGYADNNTINMVMRNLMTNAQKFTNEGGEIVISAEEKNNEWVIAVRDSGIGIKSDVLKNLFDKVNPYSTRGTANEKGTGLGLILCKEFVEKNNGRIWAESEEGKGSTFWFSIPRG